MEGIIGSVVFEDILSCSSNSYYFCPNPRLILQQEINSDIRCRDVSPSVLTQGLTFLPIELMEEKCTKSTCHGSYVLTCVGIIYQPFFAVNIQFVTASRLLILKCVQNVSGCHQHVIGMNMLLS